jgi:transcriptional regulator with XRE-family HTH domain
VSSVEVEMQLAPLDRFGALLRTWRCQRGLSQAGLAKQVHVHRDLIAKVERGRRWPSHDLVLRCEAALRAGGELSRLWPDVESARARWRLLAAAERLSLRLGHYPAVDPRHLDTDGRTPHGAFLGAAAVTIITPLKREAIRARPVVALEDVVGAQRLGDLASGLGLTPTYEMVPIGGEVDLNRADLVVICGPRLSSKIAAVLDQDPRLRFVKADDGVWVLRDLSTGLVYRSGLDAAPHRSWDVAYLGRLPRPDRNGKIMIFTGIHPQGSLGVVRIIVDEIASLNAETKGRSFSLLVGTEFHPDTSEPTRVERLTPIYVFED